VVAKLSGKAGAKIASKTGATLAGKIGSQLLDPIVGIGIIIWDVWDYHNTVKIERPILHDNIADYLQEVKCSLLYNSENGIMKAIGEIESEIMLYNRVGKLLVLLTVAIALGTLVPEAAAMNSDRDWSEVDRYPIEAVRTAHDSTEEFATYELDRWLDDLMQKVDDRFLNWYFS